jgi:hypothetical protein
MSLTSLKIGDHVLLTLEYIPDQPLWRLTVVDDIITERGMTILCLRNPTIPADNHFQSEYVDVHTGRVYHLLDLAPTNKMVKSVEFLGRPVRPYSNYYGHEDLTIPEVESEDFSSPVRRTDDCY